MRTTLLSVLSLFATLSIGFCLSAEDEADAFLTSLRSVLERKDSAALLAMHCFDGLDDAAQAKMSKQIPLLFLKDDLKSAEFVLDAEPPAPYEHNGKVFVPNLKPEKAIQVKFQRADSPKHSFETKLWIGIKNGRFMIVLTAPKPAEQTDSESGKRVNPDGAANPASTGQ